MKTIFLSLSFFLSSLAQAAPVSITSGTVSLVQVKAQVPLNPTTKDGADAAAKPTNLTPVPATIEGVTGTVDLAAGTGTLTIPVNAWDSKLEIRNTNVRTAFFQAATNPTATFELESLALDAGAGEAKGTLKLYSGSVPVVAAVKVSTDAEGTTQVATTAPFKVSISALGLNEQLAALIKLCAHPGVLDDVEVSIALTLAKE